MSKFDQVQRDALEDLYPEYYQAEQLDQVACIEVAQGNTEYENEPDRNSGEEAEEQLEKFREFKNLQVHEWMQRPARK